MTTVPVPGYAQLRRAALSEVAAPAARPRAGVRAARRVRREAVLDRVVDDYLDRGRRLDLRVAWPVAMAECGFGRAGFSALAGAYRGGVPLVVHVDAGSATTDPYLVVTLPHGLSVADLDAEATSIARGLNVHAVRITPRGDTHLRVDLIASDPLAATVPFLPEHPLGHVVYGVSEHGRVLSAPLDRLTHGCFQGETRSGKSGFGYSLLAQLAQRPDVVVAGVDPSSLLLRPFGPSPWRATGTVDPAACYAAALSGVVAEMDRRIEGMDPRRDTVQIGPDCPVIVVVLEEWAGVGRLVGHTRQRPSDTHRMVSRLLAEGAKAAVRVVIFVQRADADVLGAFEREQCLTTATFGSPNLDTLKMLHTDVTPDTASSMAGSLQGCALFEAPDIPQCRMRAPWIGGASSEGYGAYVDAVTAGSAVAA